MSSIIKTPDSNSNSITKHDRNGNLSLPCGISKNKPEKKKKIRCGVCNKKLGLLGFECKCGKMFCSTHLIAETHECTFNYTQEQCKRLQKSLIKVVHSKVPAI